MRKKRNHCGSEGEEKAEIKEGKKDEGEGGSGEGKCEEREERRDSRERIWEGRR